MESKRNLRLASFDGGGVRGLSQLAIVSNIMYRLNWRRDTNGSEAILPCQTFDLVGGSGTGGLIAIMFAKLRMSADEAADEFSTIIEDVFIPVNITPKQRTERLKRCLEDIMKRKGLPTDMKLMDEMQNDSCACFVVTSVQDNVSSKICLRSYPVRSYPTYPITVIEAALASCATMSSFYPVTVGMDRKRKEYIAAGLGATNPIREVITEAHSIFGGESNVTFLLSVGTGHPGIITLTPNDGDIGLNKAMREMMNDCTQKARETKEKLGQSGIYFRFSVEQGMQSKLSKAMDMAWIVTQTEIYLEEQNKTLEALVKTINDLPSRISLDQLESGEVIIGIDRLWAVVAARQLEKIDKIHQDNILTKLKPSDLGSSSPVIECMEGTREDVLTTIFEWVVNYKAANIFWLKGHPGVGKSAIATSLVEKLRDSEHLGSSFFFQREKSASMTLNNLWSTIAYDLARRYPEMGKYLIAVLEKDESLVTTANADKLFRELIQKPVTACKNIDEEKATVVVIDALDECGGLDSQQLNSRINLMRTLKAWSTLAKKYKLVVTSRVEPDIAHGLSTIEHESFEVLSGDSVQSKSSEDIERFLEYHLGQIAAQSHGALAPEWPGRQIITRLTQLAAGLFIWVDTVIRFLKRGEPQEQLNRVLGGTSTRGLAKLYSSILKASFMEPSDKVLEGFHGIVGAIILAKDPLPTSSLVHLCSMDHSTLSYIRSGLQSVLDSGEFLRFSHQSFVDFLIDPTQCPSAFCIDIQKQKREFTLACLRTMRTHLRFNICDVKSSYKRNTEIVNLDRRVKECIPHYVSYSAYYWVKHLKETGFDEEILGYVEYFMQNQFLFWLEVLSLTKRVSIATHMLLLLIRWLRDGKQSDNMAVDMKRFIATFSTVISQSMPHIYISALSLSPQNSAVYREYAKYYPQRIRFERAGYEEWPTIQKDLLGHKSAVSSVAFSPDGTRVVSASYDKTIQVWDPETAEMVAGPFEGHLDGVTSVEFSPNGTRIVSGSYDMKILVWDAGTAEIVAGPFEGHNDIVSSVGFSPDGTRVLSGSYDKTIRVWDAETAQMLAGPFVGHTKIVTSVAFSPDGTRIVSGSDDKTIRLWDAKTAEMVARPFEGHTQGVRSVAFSSDGKRVVSGSYDKTIRIWDVTDAKIVAGPFEGHAQVVSSVAFSPDGTRIASGSHDSTIRVWDAETAQMIARPFEGHTSWVRSVGFSPDGTRIVSGSQDNTIRVWDADIAELVPTPFEGHNKAISSVAFSPDGTCVVSGSHDTTIRMWDAETAQMLAKPFEGHTDAVISVSISPDGTQLVSGSRDTTVRVWDIKTGEIATGPVEENISTGGSTEFMPDGAHLVSGPDDMTDQMWDAEPAEMVAEPFEEHITPVEYLAFSPDTAQVTSGSHDEEPHMWDANIANIAVGQFNRHSEEITSVTFSPDGARIASGSRDSTVCVWDAKTAQIIVGPFIGHKSSVRSVGFSPDGRRIVSGSHDTTIRVWNAETAQIVAGPFEGHRKAVSSATFSPDGMRVASGSWDCTVRIWDVETAEMATRPFKGHTDWVSSVAFSPDGARIVSGAHDKTIRVWDAKTTELLAGPFEGHTSIVSSVSFSPDGTRIVSGSYDKTIRVWLITTSGSSGSFLSDTSRFENGWILGPAYELLFWVPPALQAGLFRPSTVSVIGERLVTKLSFEQFVHGEAWVFCKDPLPDQVPHHQNLIVQAPPFSRSAKRKIPLDDPEEQEQCANASVSKRIKV